MDIPKHETEQSPEGEMSPEMAEIAHLANQAGEILKRYHRTELAVEYKADAFDPVSIADRESDAFLRAGIATAFPGDEILSEESPLRPDSYSGRVWMIDPLDDTKGYLRGDDTSSVMIGLLENGEPKLGLVYLPFRDVSYYAEAGKGAFVRRNGQVTRLRASTRTSMSGAMLVGRHPVAGDDRPIDAAVAALGFGSTIAEGSIGAKVGLIAEGAADAFIHTNLKAGKWDTLASEVILTEAGGAALVDIDGRALDYTKPTSGWDRYFMAAGTSELRQQMIQGMEDKA